MVQDTRDIQIDGGRLSANIMHFARCLRVAGMPIAFTCDGARPVG